MRSVIGMLGMVVLAGFAMGVGEEWRRELWAQTDSEGPQKSSPVSGETAQLKQSPESYIEQDFRSLELFAVALHHLSRMYVDVSASRVPLLVEAAMQGMVSGLDPHTVLMSKEMFDRLHDFTKGQYGGVGLIVTENQGKVFVISVVKGAPAERVGIRKGDEIVQIDDRKLGENLEETRKSFESIRGEPGTKLTITVLRQGKRKEFELTREVVASQSVMTKTLAPGIGHIRISNFQEDTSEQVKSYLAKHMSGLKGLILDLRNNPGGLLEEAVKVADLFLDAGVIVSTVGRDPQKIEREYALAMSTYSHFPMIVLVNNQSASASEIVAGALQDHQRALVMGERTFGKGSVQTLLALPHGGGLKITVARYYTPNGRSIQTEGIFPDIQVSAQFPRQNTDTDRGPGEHNLKGHIVKKELRSQKDSLLEGSQVTGFEEIIKTWSEDDQKDRVLRTAFIYLKGWTRLGVYNKTSLKSPSQWRSLESPM